MHPEDEGHESDWASPPNSPHPSSPIPPLSPTGFGFDAAQLSRATDVMAKPSSSHNQVFERTESTTTVYGFVDLGEPLGATVGFDHFVGGDKYPTTHKLNP